QDIAVRQAGRGRSKPWVLTTLGAPYYCAQRLPLRIIVHSDSEPAVCASCWVHAMRGQMRISIPDALLTPPVHRVIQQRRGKKVQRRLGLRLIDILPLAGAAPIVERG